uniref:Zinc-ribbon domain-containing protein n=1 Tax=Roseihalotalea indica TaxID=2867963 RepID=A0AA49GNQ1_9BACT|nr:zinc-ribbon domain-containing protein [Tunicatimonas sp. TK19036]
MSSPIEEMQYLARKRGGLCLSDLYINSKSKLWWQCAEGHRWQATPFSVKIRKSWCPFCANNRPHGIERMKALAATKGGTCLSEEYINSKTPLRWQCKNGHRFLATADSVVQGKWCQECNDSLKHK